MKEHIRNIIVIFTIALGVYLVVSPLAVFSKTTVNYNYQEMNDVKICSICKLEKDINRYSKSKNTKDGLDHRCKSCNKDRRIKKHRSKVGLIQDIRKDQVQRSKKWNEKVGYSTDELIKWCMNQPIYHSLFEAWELSGYAKLLVPSIDRIDDYGFYVFDNIQLMTWESNREKGYRDMANLINKKKVKTVYQYDLKGVLINTYPSVVACANDTGFGQSSIQNCCRGETKSSYGYLWSYKGGLRVSNDSIRGFIGVTKYSINGELLDKYKNIKEASIRSNISYASIYDSCINRVKTTNGFVFIYTKDEVSFNINDRCNLSSKIVYQYNKDNKLLNMFDSVSKASEATGARIDSISKTCLNKQQTAGGFKWSYKKEGGDS